MAKRWLLTGSLNTPHCAYTATLLNNGKVLLVGGFDSINPSEHITGVCEIYDPVAKTWSTTASLGTARAFHQAVLLQDGTVMVVGGFVNYATQTSTAVCEIYNPGTGLWSNTGSLSSPSVAGGLWLLNNGKVLHAGGEVSGSPNTSVSTAQLYDPNTSTWTATGSLNTARHVSATILLASGNALMVSGKNNASLTQTAEIYNVGSATWGYTTGAPTFAGEMDGGNTCVTLQTGKTLFVGFVDALDNRSHCQLYDPNTDTFTSTGDLALGRSELCVFLQADGTVLSAGGEIHGSPETSVINVEVYDPIAGTWSGSPNLRVARGTGPLGQGVLLADGTPLWAGGSDNITQVYSSAEIYKEDLSMAIALVQQNFRGNTTAGSFTAGVTSTGAGNLLVVWVAQWTAQTPFSITDNAGNTYVNIPACTIAGTQSSVQMFYAKNSIAGATLLTFTPLVGVPAQNMLYFFEFSGASTTSPLDVGNASSPGLGTGASVSGLVTPSATTNVLVAGAVNGSFAYSGGISTPSWVSLHDTSIEGACAGYLLSPATSSQQAAFSPNTATDYSGNIASFKVASSGPSANQKASMFLVF